MGLSKSKIIENEIEKPNDPIEILWRIPSSINFEELKNDNKEFNNKINIEKFISRLHFILNNSHVLDNQIIHICKIKNCRNDFCYNNCLLELYGNYYIITNETIHMIKYHNKMPTNKLYEVITNKKTKIINDQYLYDFYNY